MWLELQSREKEKKRKGKKKEGDTGQRELTRIKNERRWGYISVDRSSGVRAEGNAFYV